MNHDNWIMNMYKLVYLRDFLPGILQVSMKKRVGHLPNSFLPAWEKFDYQNFLIY